jgi:putative ABC transport system permease protein
MSLFRQIVALLQMSLRGIPRRLVASLVTLVGIACVVGVLVSMLSMGVGVRQLALQDSRTDRVIVSSKGAQNIVASSLDTATVAAIGNAPGIRKDEEGKQLLATRIVELVDLRKKSNHVRTNLPLFGVGTQFFHVRPEIRLSGGRMFRPGLHEMIVGESRQALYEGLALGDQVRLHGADWTVVGQFDAHGSAFENDLIADADTVASAFGRNTIQEVTVVLDSPRGYEAFASALAANPAISVDVKHEAEWTAMNFKPLTGLLDFISYFVATVMAIGASLGALNVMYSIVDARNREIATLRAIGFGASPVVVSVILESMLLALPGALLGALIAWAWFNGHAVSPFGVGFRLAVTPALIELGIVWALVIGLIGGLLPALRAARVPVATALRAI